MLSYFSALPSWQSLWQKTTGEGVDSSRDLSRYTVSESELVVLVSKGSCWTIVMTAIVFHSCRFKALSELCSGSSRQLCFDQNWNNLSSFSQPTLYIHLHNVVSGSFQGACCVCCVAYLSMSISCCRLRLSRRLKWRRWDSRGKFSLMTWLRYLWVKVTNHECLRFLFVLLPDDNNSWEKLFRKKSLFFMVKFGVNSEKSHNFCTRHKFGQEEVIWWAFF